MDKQLQEFCRPLPSECRLVLVHLESRYATFCEQIIDASTSYAEGNEILVWNYVKKITELHAATVLGPGEELP